MSIYQQSPEQEIESDQLDQLRENPDRCASISVRAGRHPWVRWNGDAYEIAEMGYSRLEVEVCTKDSLLNLLAENPVDIKPLSAAMYSPPDPGEANVWEHVDARDEHEHVVYTDRTEK